MSVAAILKHKGHDVAAVPPTARVTDVLQILVEWRIGAVVVQDKADQLLGIVSERDVVRALARDGAAMLDMSAAQLMSTGVLTVEPLTSVARAMAIMTEHRVRHLPVLDDGDLAGMVSIGDVVRARLDEQADEVEGLKAYLAGNV